MLEELNINLGIQVNGTSFPLINSVINGLQGGKIYSEGEAIFIIHKANFSYIKAKCEIEYQSILNFIIQSHVLPNYFHVYEPPLEFFSICEESSDSIEIKVRKRIQLRFERGHFPLGESIPFGFQLCRIGKDSFDKLSIFHLSLDNKFWKSKEDFLNNGFGFSLNNELGSPVSICYSACVAGNIAEIDVFTLPEYRNRGLAKATTAKFVIYCLENGIIANWDCFENNYESLKTAEGLGFKRTRRYDFLSIFNKIGSHETD